MAVKASGRFVPPSAFAAGTGKAFTGAYAWNAPREAVGRERPLMVMLLALHVLSIFPLSTGKNTVKDR